jgi:DNA polymerase-3 subunit gamma/tau
MTEPPVATDTAADLGPDPGPYRVLARKYRPTSFEALIGQEALVRTLTNAFESGRLAHAYMLSGVRGIGKTTTARIIARALNCVGPDGNGGPTASPCGVCEHCRAIAEDRHVDVIEMDAASRTGVNDIRELIDAVPYRPVSARYKVYIIDEVHMLSNNAFNALLKTLEEPPEHVRFVFATTEIRKVPVTVLSRCQRFDLRRLDAGTLTTHFAGIADKEGAAVSEAALKLIARAADGSVRDGLSLLDQAISHSVGAVDEEAVREMLGLADRSVTFDLLDAVLGGDIKAALALLAGQYGAGADPVMVVGDLLELTHWLTRIKVVPESADAPGVPEAERVRGVQMAERLSMAEVTRAWQMLLKGLGETRTAPSPLQAAEMVLIRLAYAARLPTPAEALKAAEKKGATGPAAAARPSSSSSPSSSGAADPPSTPPPATTTTAIRRSSPPETPERSGPNAALAGVLPESSPEPPVVPMAVPTAPPPAALADFEDVVRLVRDHREAILYGHLVADVHLVRFAPGHIELRPGQRAPTDLPRQLSRFLTDHTGQRWLVTVSREPGAAPLREQRRAAETARFEQATKHPLVEAVLTTFPGAVVEEVRDIAPPSEETAEAEADDEDE